MTCAPLLSHGLGLLRRLGPGGFLGERAGLAGIDLEEVVENNQHHGSRAKDYGQAVELVVADHDEEMWLNVWLRDAHGWTVGNEGVWHILSQFDAWYYDCVLGRPPTSRVARMAFAGELSSSVANGLWLRRRWWKGHNSNCQLADCCCTGLQRGHESGRGAQSAPQAGKPCGSTPYLSMVPMRIPAGTEYIVDAFRPRRAQARAAAINVAQTHALTGLGSTLR